MSKIYFIVSYLLLYITNILMADCQNIGIVGILLKKIFNLSINIKQKINSGPVEFLKVSEILLKIILLKIILLKYQKYNINGMHT